MADLELGSADHGVRFTWTPRGALLTGGRIKGVSGSADSYVIADGKLRVDVWNGEWAEAASVTLDAGGALELAQWVNCVLGRD